MERKGDVKLIFASGLGRKIRLEPPAVIGRSTVHFLRDALQVGQAETCFELFDYLVLEHRTALRIYEIWNWELVRFLVRECRQEASEVYRTTLLPWLPVTLRSDVTAMKLIAVGRQGLQGCADGRRFAIREGRSRLLFDFGQNRAASKLRRALRLGFWEKAGRLLEEYLSRARLAHDVASDWAWATLTRVAEIKGEAELERVFRLTQARWFTKRYARLGALTPEEFLALTVEGMRGHFSGPARLGDIEVTDHGDHYILSFDPCGTGGRMRRGDEPSGSPPRAHAPYHFGFTSRPWPWSWHRSGICYYCAHCAMVNEIVPIELVGYPMRVTEHPEDPMQPCCWVLYKDPRGIPAEAYRRVGKEPPEAS